MNINKTLQLLDIQEVTTKRQKKNGVRNTGHLGAHRDGLD